MNELALQIKTIFTENFSGSPAIYFSPGRINLIGEHIDYNDGYVMPAAIDKGIYYAMAKNGTVEMNFYAVDYDEKFTCKITEVKRSEGWKNYLLSVVHEFLVLGKPVSGFDCAFTGNIPIGSGMSSSAAVEGGLAFALNEIFDCGLNRVELALLCQRAEHNYPNVKCGIMDMYASLHGRKNHVLLLDCKNISHVYFPLKLDGFSIVLMNSKVQHSLAAGEYNIRRQRCEQGLAILKDKLKIESFRDISYPEQIKPFQNLLTNEMYDCCTYVVEEIQRTKKAAMLLQQHDIAGFGKLMFQTHAGLSKRYRVSCTELDLLVELAAADENVAGARLMGGGFGGCTINIVRTAAVNDFIEMVSDAYKKQFNILPEAYIVEISDGTHKIEE